MSRPPRRALATSAVTAGVAAAYFAAARLGLSMAFAAEQVTVIWPPTGIAIAALGSPGAWTRIWDVMALLGLAGLVASSASATIGVASLCLSGLHPWSAFGGLWWLWWLGDLMGVVLTAPLLLTASVRC